MWSASFVSNALDTLNNIPSPYTTGSATFAITLVVESPGWECYVALTSLKVLFAGSLSTFVKRMISAGNIFKVSLAPKPKPSQVFFGT